MKKLKSFHQTYPNALSAVATMAACAGVFLAIAVTVVYLSPNIDITD